MLLPATSTASARRFDQHGTWRLLVFMQWLKLRYLTGTDPAELAHRYAAGPGRWPLPHRTALRRSGEG